MTASTITTVAPEVNRDHWGRPLITPPDGGKAKPYTRATTLAGTLDNLYGLMGWKQRQTALGLAAREDLLTAVAAHANDKKRLDEICEQALEASKSSAAATMGTAIHALSEKVDRGEELPPLPAATAADLEAYRRATADLEPVLIEQMVVLDDLQVAGTPDRIVRCPDGVVRIADLKTGNVTFAAQKIAIQLALYAHGQVYDVATGERTPLPEGLDLETAIVIHLPAGSGTCEQVDVDIAAGWEAVEYAVWTREWQKRRDLIRPRLTVDVVAEAIAAATTTDELVALYRTHREVWTEKHTALAGDRKKALTA